MKKIEIIKRFASGLGRDAIAAQELNTIMNIGHSGSGWFGKVFDFCVVERGVADAFKESEELFHGRIRYRNFEGKRRRYSLKTKMTEEHPLSYVLKGRSVMDRVWHDLWATWQSVIITVIAIMMAFLFSKTHIASRGGIVSLVASLLAFGSWLHIIWVIIKNLPSRIGFYQKIAETAFDAFPDSEDKESAHQRIGFFITGVFTTRSRVTLINILDYLCDIDKKISGDGLKMYFAKDEAINTDYPSLMVGKMEPVLIGRKRVRMSEPRPGLRPVIKNQEQLLFSIEINNGKYIVFFALKDAI